jgi:membrane-associated phospholipid phosphatase
MGTTGFDCQRKVLSAETVPIPAEPRAPIDEVFLERTSAGAEAVGSGAHAASCLKRVFTTVLGPCGAFEWVALSYLLFSGALMLGFAQKLPHAAYDIAQHFGVFTAILLVAHLDARERLRHPAPQLGTIGWMRCWYPQLTFLFCFEELRILVHLVYPGWHDPQLIAFDHWLTGVYPAVWLSQFSTFWLNEAMQIAYMSYFLFLIVLGADLYHRRLETPSAARGREPVGPAAMSAFWTVMTATMLAYAIGYVISILFPVEAPFFAMRSFALPPLAGGPASRLINFIESWGRVRGGAFPSAHVSGSFVALLGAWHFRRHWFWVFLPLFMAMCVSTVYGRYHYLADVFAGVLVGGVGFLLALRMMKFPGANPEEKLPASR